MRELTDGEQTACRNRAIQKVRELIGSFSENVSPEEKWSKLAAFFNKNAQCVERAAENFDPAEYFARGHDAVTDDGQLKCLINGNLTGLATLEEITQEMKRSNLSRVNGTSLEFQKCIAFVEEQQIRFKKSKEIYETNGAVCQSPEKQSVLTALKARVYEIIAGLLFIPDLLNA